MRDFQQGREGNYLMTCMTMMTPLTNEVEHLDYKHLHAEAPRAVNDNDDLHTQGDCIALRITSPMDDT